MESDTVGIGIIGTGFARKVQIPAFLRCAGANVVSVASGTIENAASTAREFGIGHFTDDWRETVARDDVQLVCITTPPDLHLPMVLECIEHRKHILCEKPMAMNLAEAVQMRDAAIGSERLALIDHELRFQPGRITAREMIQSGAIGKILHAKSIFRAPHRGDPQMPWNWWSDAQRGGGALGAIGSHVIDSFHWFMDVETESVMCQLASHIRQRPTADGALRAVTSDDEANMLMQFADGSTGLVSISMIEGPDYQNRMEFYGSFGTIAIDHRGELSIAKRGSDWQKITVDIGEHIDGLPDTGFARAFVDQAPHIVAAISQGRSQIAGAATFADGVRVQAVLDAARRSSELGRRVRVGEIG